VNFATTAGELARDHGKTCPSSYCAEGATLLGVIGPEGKLIYRETLTKVDKAFVEIASQGRSPEKRFRFAHKCVKCGCKQWVGGECSVIDTVLAAFTAPATADAPLPNCSIRATCRWFAQRGAAACSICPEITTDTREDIPRQV
jgi:hypothetical protein